MKKKGKRVKKTADQWQQELGKSIPAGHGSSIRVTLLPDVPRLGPRPLPDEPGAIFPQSEIRRNVG
jgi:hypothetical protein